LFDAAVGALAHCQRRLLERLAGIGDQPSPPATATQRPDGGRPTAVVLWVKPDFPGWTVPRGRQPALSRRHQLQVNRFVREVKSSGTVGTDVSGYLIQGLAASGAVVPLEENEGALAMVGGLRDKLLELRMAGWVGDRLPYDDPGELARQAGAQIVVTARLTRIEEPQPTGATTVLAAAVRSELRAWAEIEAVELASGRRWTATGEGVAGKSGWSTGVAYTPETNLDQTLFGSAVRAAIFDAAARLRLD